MTLRGLLLAALPVALVATVACDDASPTAPTRRATATSADTSAAAETSKVCGQVRTYYSISAPEMVGAVTVSASSSLGSFSATTDADGTFCVSATGDAQLQFAKQGFTTVTQRAYGGLLHLVVTLLPSDARNVYAVTITASASCNLPPEAMQRTNDAIVDLSDSVVTVMMTSYAFVVWGGTPGFTGRRDGQVVEFELSDDLEREFQLVERLSIGDLSYSGTAVGTLTDERIVATFSGTIRLGNRASCTAADHRLELVRAGTS